MSSRNSGYRLSSNFQRGDRLFACHGRECFEELFQRISGFEVNKETLHGNLVPTKTGVPPMISGSV